MPVKLANSGLRERKGGHDYRFSLSQHYSGRSRYGNMQPGSLGKRRSAVGARLDRVCRWSLVFTRQGPPAEVNRDANIARNWRDMREAKPVGSPREIV